MRITVFWYKFDWTLFQEFNETNPALDKITVGPRLLSEPMIIYFTDTYALLSLDDLISSNYAQGGWGFKHVSLLHSWQPFCTWLLYKAPFDAIFNHQNSIFGYFIVIDFLMLLFCSQWLFIKETAFLLRKLIKSDRPYGSQVLCKLYPRNNQAAICIHHSIFWNVWQEYNWL